jgi:hypothetical protein
MWPVPGSTPAITRQDAAADLPVFLGLALPSVTSLPLDHSYVSKSMVKLQIDLARHSSS